MVTVIIQPIHGTPEYTNMKMGVIRDLVKEAVERGLKETGYDRFLRIEEVCA